MRVDLAFVNGPVFMPPGRPVGGLVVAIRGGTIVAIAPEGEEIAAERVVDLGGRLLLPGFGDAHVHPVHGGMRRLQCDMTDIDDADEAMAAIRAAAADARDWVLGGGWLFTWFDRGRPSADFLEELTGGTPAYLVVRDGHSAWVNRSALHLAGIGADTPDPPDGRIERLPDGSPQGVLHEGAMDLVKRLTPKPSRSTVELALREGQRVLVSHGVTAWQDAWVTEEEHRAYLALAGRGELVAQVRGALWWDRARGLEQMDDIVRMSSERAERYRPSAVKLMLDGIVENHTAALLDPYTGHRCQSSGGVGLDFIVPDLAREAVVAIERAGLQAHFHAIGDRAVRSALDAVAHARRLRPDDDLRHHIAHIQVVHPDDLPRFAALGVSANCQALWACADEAMVDLTIPLLGPVRTQRQYPFGAIAATGGHLAMGSDWPVSTPDVMAQVHVAVTRTAMDDARMPPFLPDQALSLSQALTGFTAGSARVNGLEATRGTIEVGKVADLVVLDADPFGGGALADIGVDLTVVGGRVVYEHGRLTI
jgi:predicted amidohydrolase YtcJ